MKKINIICPTYRKNENEFLRKVGVLDLVYSVIGKDNIRLCIIDSSPQRLDLFKRKSVYSNIIYLHTPTKEEAFDRYKGVFPYMLDFCITRKHSKFYMYDSLISAWDNFIPWNEGYPITSSLNRQFSSERPSIGMKRNMAIAALEETFGSADIVCYADDDDFRSENYFEYMAKMIQKNDFVRISKWLTCYFQPQPRNTIYGVHNLNLQKDYNGYYLIGTKDKKLYSSREVIGLSSSIEERFSKLIRLAFSPLSYEGAMHVYTMDLWKRSVKEFGGVPPISIAEDVLFFKQCEMYFGKEFCPSLIKNREYNFIRGAHNNTSIVEWTHSVEKSILPLWAQNKINFISAIINSEASLIPFENKIKKILDEN